MSSPSEMKDQHILSSNLPHLEATLLACRHAPSVTAVLQSFRYTPPGGRGSDAVLVDVVACGGGAWVKIFARKRSALHLYWLGMCVCGVCVCVCVCVCVVCVCMCKYTTEMKVLLHVI